MAARAGLCPLALALALVSIDACVLTGIEPDEIDVADESEGGVSTTAAGTEAGTDEDGTQGGDGDGDDHAEEGAEAGDGDGDLSDCSAFAPSDLQVGANAVELVEGPSAIESSCGGPGPERVYQFVAPAAGVWQFEIVESEFVDVLTLVDGCAPLDELVCASAPSLVQAELAAEQIVFVVVDSQAAGGTATLVIEPG